MESMKDYEKELERSFRTIREGDILSGTVVSVSEEEITVDLSYYTQGIIKAENFSNDPYFAVLEQVHPGDPIEATVIRADDGRGNIELSKKEANDTLAWDKLKDLMEQGSVVTVRVKESVPKGVIAYLEGIRAFIPVSQIAADYVEDTAAWVGKEIDAKVITADKEKGKLLLSGKAVQREREAEERRHRISMLVPGAIVEGTVESIMPYGAFVSIGNGISGLVHISQISRKRLKSPNEVLKEGQKVRAKILNTNDNKVSLSMKVLEEITDREEEDSEVSADIEKYASGESIGTGLGDLFAKLKI